MKPAPAKRESAPAVDLVALGDRRFEKRRMDRLRYLCESNAVITAEEIGFWWGPFERLKNGKRDWKTGGWLRRENPFLLERCGAYIIKQREEGYGRFFPNGEQDEIIKHREKCWANRIVADIWTLKCRQDGMSTEGELSDLSMGMAVEECYLHIVGNEVANTEKMLQIIRLAVTGLPYWMRPADKNMRDSSVKGVFEINDEAARIRGLAIKTDTAKKDEVIGRGEPAQFRHYTECEFWYNQMTAFTALRGAQVRTFPASQTCETTGNRTVNSFFHKRFFSLYKKPDKNFPGKAAFFFPWYSHAEYRLQLPKGVTAEAYWDQLENETDSAPFYLAFKSHGCDVEQAHWYMTSLNEMREGGAPLDYFFREFPFTPEESFLGGASKVFDADKLKTAEDLARFHHFGNLKKVPHTAFPCTRGDDWSPIKARCKLVYNPETDDQPVLVDSHFHGDAVQYEAPRNGHRYIVTADLAENKLSDPGVLESSDWTRIKVIRVTADPRCDEMVLATVLTVRSKLIGVLETAKTCVGLGLLYKEGNGREALINFEHNTQGLAFEVEGRRLGGRLYEHFKEDGIKQSFVGFGVQVSRGETALSSKNYSVSLLSQAIATGIYRPLDPDEIDEMRIFQCNEKGVYGAPSGSHDDTISTSRLMCVTLASQNDGLIRVQQVRADGDLNFAEQPDAEDIDEALLESSFKKMMPKPNKKSKQIGKWNAV